MEEIARSIGYDMIYNLDNQKILLAMMRNIDAAFMIIKSAYEADKEQALKFIENSFKDNIGKNVSNDKEVSNATVILIARITQMSLEESEDIVSRWASDMEGNVF